MSGDEPRAARGRQVGGGQRGGGGGRGQAGPGQDAVPPERVAGRRAWRVGELDGDRVERAVRDDAVELLDGALGFLPSVKPHEPHAFR